MEIEIVTMKDLQAFRLQLLAAIRELIGVWSTNTSAIKCLKNCEVRSLLKVSANTVQRLRITGKLRSTKSGGTYYYRAEDITLPESRLSEK